MNGWTSVDDPEGAFVGSVLIASIGRKSLIRTIESVLLSISSSSMRFNVIVADDSQNQSVSELLNNNGSSCHEKISVIQSRSSNIAHARNVLLAAAIGDYALFVDDDEWVEEGWLGELVRVARLYDADVVGGPVKAHYPSNTSPVVKLVDPFSKRWGVTGQQIRLASTSNALLRLSFFRNSDIVFDEALGISGGEDTDLFARATLYGAKIVASADALVHEEVNAERLEWSYLSRRLQRSGQSYASAALVGRGFQYRCGFLVSALLKVFFSYFMYKFCIIFSCEYRYRMRMKFFLNSGKVRHFFSLRLHALYGSSGDRVR